MKPKHKTDTKSVDHQLKKKQIYESGGKKYKLGRSQTTDLDLKIIEIEDKRINSETCNSLEVIVKEYMM